MNLSEINRLGGKQRRIRPPVAEAPMRPICRTVPLLALAALATALLPSAAGARTPQPPAACVDFEAHANHAWRQAHPLPAGSERISRLGQFEAAAAERRQRLLAEVVATPRDEREQLLAAFWAAGSDPARLDAGSAAALATVLAPSAGLRRNRDLPRVLAQSQALGLAPLFEFRRLDDGRGALAAGPVPLGLGDPAFYLRPEPELRALLDAYRAHLQDLLQASGLAAPQAAAAADATLRIEARLAQALATDPGATPPAARLRELERRHPGLGLGAVLDALDADARELVLLHPAYFDALATLAAEAASADWQALLRARALLRLAPALGAPFRTAHAEFEGRVLRGLDSPPDAATLLAERMRRQLPGLLDEVANARLVDAPLRARAEAVLRNVQAAAAARDPRFGEVLIDLAGSATPATDWSGLRFAADDAAGNLLRLERWRQQRVLRAEPLPVSPFPALRPALQFDPATRRLAVSAAALAPPLLGATPGAADYGALGALAGHELSKAVPADDRGLGLVALYDGFEAAPGLRVDGRRTLAMNRADLAGLEFAWAAFAQAHPDADATARRGFFEAWAGLWAQRATPALLREEQQRSTAAPARWRVNGPLSQLPAFAAAFGCRAGQPMRAANPITVWR